MQESRGKIIAILLLNAAIAAWCAYDLWFAADPGSMISRVLNYLFLAATAFIVFGSILRLRSGQ